MALATPRWGGNAPPSSPFARGRACVSGGGLAGASPPFPRGDDDFRYPVYLFVSHGRERVNGCVDRVTDFVGEFPVTDIPVTRGLGLRPWTAFH